MRIRLSVEAALRDARFATRMLRRAPAFAAAAVLTLGIAIGVNTAIFSVVDAVLLRPLPYPQPDRLALVTGMEAGAATHSFGHSGRAWEMLRDQASSIDRAVFSTWTTGVNMLAGQRGAEVARNVRQQRVGAGFFRVLGVPPLVGREFDATEDRPGAPAVTILSAGL